MVKKISIVLGVRNRDEHLKNCLFSLEKQTMSEDKFEVIVVNYGGKTKTKNVVKSIKIKFIKYIYVDDKGIFNESRAKNIGIRNSTGELIVCTNSDIIYDKKFLENFYKIIKTRKNNYLYQVRRNDLFPETNVGDMEKRFGKDKIFGNNEFFIGPISGEGDFQATTKDIWEKITGYDERMTGWGYLDIDLSYRMKKLGIKQKWLDNHKFKLYHQYHKEKEISKLNINTLLSKSSTYLYTNRIGWGQIIKKINIYHVGFKITKIKNAFKNIELNSSNDKFSINNNKCIVSAIKKTLETKSDWLVINQSENDEDVRNMIKSIDQSKINGDFIALNSFSSSSKWQLIISRLFKNRQKGIYIFSNRILSLLMHSSKAASINFKWLIEQSERVQST